jgi:hypothetical protein
MYTPKIESTIFNMIFPWQPRLTGKLVVAHATHLGQLDAIATMRTSNNFRSRYNFIKFL